MKSLSPTKRKPKPKPPEQPAKEPDPYPYPIGQVMPRGWKPDRAFRYISIGQNFSVAPRMFFRGDVVRPDDPVAAKLIYSCPKEWIYVAWKEEED
jgi:hypothetical protein